MIDKTIVIGAWALAQGSILLFDSRGIPFLWPDERSALNNIGSKQSAVNVEIRVINRSLQKRRQK